MKRLLVWAVSVCLFVTAAAWVAYASWSGMSERFEALEPPAPSPTQVRWAKVEVQELRDWIHGQGTARAVRRRHLTFEVPGRVVEIADAMREGARVHGPSDGRQGQLIARLDDVDHVEAVRIADTGLIQAERNVDMAQAQLRQSKSTEKLWRARLDRAKALLDKKVISQQKFDEATAELEVAIANVAASEAQVVAREAGVLAARNEVSRARRNMERAKIHAPWDGVIARLNIREGKYVVPEDMSNRNETEMTATFPVTLIDTSTFKVEVEVPMHRRTQLQVGNPAQILRGPMGVAPLEAHIHAVAPMLSPGSRTVRVTLRTKATNPNLIDGELVQVKILRVAQRVPTIPVEALLYHDNQAKVMLVDPETGIVDERELITGIREDTVIEVKEGLSPGEIVVTDGRHRVLSGDPVHLLEEEGDK
ncbi:Macrolide export protein MacA [Falsiruegeria litorea R37]|uniref:Macrolide export protein MacA n=1 Tax=Falsiruegeria litorea R37 TaxID=1200284 RepID=A0A1Y5TTT9_9RHOB|nr:efflux RND transporter periplasmic adaptor subunit [Falsiruegeria litorea]SLN72469.1 Macrolide export protein MacA [Falsiruegeria litorea R37]